MPPSDTSTATHRVYFERLAALKPGERVQIAARLWETANALQQAALKHTNPTATNAEIAFQIAVTRFGSKLATAAFHKT